MDSAQKGQVQQRDNYACLKEFNHSTPQPINTENSFPVGEQVWLEQERTLSPFLNQRIKCLLRYIELSLILWVQTALDRRTLIWGQINFLQLQGARC